FDKLATVTGGATPQARPSQPMPTKATYLGQCGFGAAEGALGAAGMVGTFAAMGGPPAVASLATPTGAVTAAGLVAAGAASGCGQRMLRLYEARRPQVP